MIMNDGEYLSIGDVVRQTDLTERALRYYEERGLLAPLRTEGGRRAYSAANLERIHLILFLRRARFSLSQIRALLNERRIDLTALVELQMDSLQSERRAIDDSIRSLSAVKSAIDEGTELTVELLSGWLKVGGPHMTEVDWQKLYDKFYAPEEQKKWKAAKQNMPPDFDQRAYEEKWRSLSRRIADALPMEPDSEKAQLFLKKWNELLEPFMAVADDKLARGAARLWDSLDQWPSEIDPPISKAVWEFMSAARQDRRSPEPS